MTRSSPTLAMACLTVSMARWKLVFQMLRPSTTPAEKTCLGPSFSRTGPSCSGLRTRSTWRP
ncbi:hypothetical protein CH063_09372 [Colletotrichum higginsianum]|uniref:Uncharacterized protein n=1 Tax=Colletotrichum higginsianum (strain IMI 349063) TaxID=759273 RepID=H1VDC2_COLHI|nr:hypothetical protein CH063_09372 [Colletotrichum higginsianum]